MSFGSLLTKSVRKARNLRVTDQRKGFELTEIETLKKVVDTFEVDCIFDVGANAGQYATLLRNKVGYKGPIISFEPLPAEFAALRSKASGNWIVEPIALSDADGRAMFNVSFGSEFSSLSPLAADAQDLFCGSAVAKETIEIRTECLGTVLNRWRANLDVKRPFLKLDTQGYDHRIVMGAKAVLPRFVGFQTELAVRPLYQTSVSYLEALRDYEALGLRPCAFFPNNFGHFPYLHEIDCVLLREDGSRN